MGFWNRSTPVAKRVSTLGKAAQGRKPRRPEPPPAPKHAVRLLIWGTVALVIAGGIQWLAAPEETPDAQITSGSKGGAKTGHSRWERLIQPRAPQDESLNG